MSTLVVDRILPRNGSTVVVESASLSGTPADGSDIVSAAYANSALEAAQAHAFSNLACSVEFPNDDSPFTISVLFHRVGDIVTMAWGLFTFTAYSTTMSGPAVPDSSAFLPIPALMYSEIGYMISETKARGKISVSNAGIVSLYSEDGPFALESEYIVYGGSMSWPLY